MAIKNNIDRFRVGARNDNKKGFTLAEVLITLGIIGIVAAMTIPSLLTNIQDRQFKSMYKKYFSTLSQAMLRNYEDTGETFSYADWREMPFFICNVQKYMKVQSSGIDCSKVYNRAEAFWGTDSWPRTENSDKLWHSGAQWYDKKGKPMYLNGGYLPLTFVLLDGTMFNFNCYNSILLDVNGKNGPNVVGRDIYFLRFKRDSAAPVASIQVNEEYQTNACTQGGSNSTIKLTKDNYVEDCLKGTGWGARFYICSNPNKLNLY